jgi:hypothetical protein
MSPSNGFAFCRNSFSDTYEIPMSSCLNNSRLLLKGSLRLRAAKDRCDH